MRPHRFSVLALVAALAACGEGPFIDQELNTTVAKPVDTLEKTGRLDICYDSKDKLGEAEALAAQTCAAYGLQSRLRYNDLYQCRVGTPHRAMFQCYDPDMTDKLGEYINPFSKEAVDSWQRRTGGKKGPAVPRGTVVRGAGPDQPKPADAPPAPAQLTPVPQAPTAAAPAPQPATPFGSSQFNPPRPVPQAPAVEPPPPPPPPPGIGNTFQLPMGSWGDSFEKE